MVRFDRPSRAGGIALFINSNINFKVVDISEEFKHVEIVAMDVVINNFSCRVVGYYKAAAGSNIEAFEYMVQSVKCFQKLCSTDLNIVF